MGATGTSAKLGFVFQEEVFGVDTEETCSQMPAVGLEVELLKHKEDVLSA